MESLDQIKEKLSDYSEVSISAAKDSLTVKSADDSEDISVSYKEDGGKFTVTFEGRTEEFVQMDQALKSFVSTLEMFGLWPL